MPKYPRACNNRQFHEKWGSGENVNGINLRRNGLSDLANTFEKFLKEEHGIKSPAVTNVCSDCLQKCLQMRVFTKYLATNTAKTIETKVKNISKSINIYSLFLLSQPILC